MQICQEMFGAGLRLSKMSLSAALPQPPQLNLLCSELMEKKREAQHHQNYKQVPSGRLLEVLSESAALTFHKDEGWRQRQSQTSKKQIFVHVDVKKTPSNKISPRAYGRVRKNHSGWQS